VSRSAKQRCRKAAKKAALLVNNTGSAGNDAVSCPTPNTSTDTGSKANTTPIPIVDKGDASKDSGSAKPPTSPTRPNRYDALREGQDKAQAQGTLRVDAKTPKSGQRTKKNTKSNAIVSDAISDSAAQPDVDAGAAPKSSGTSAKVVVAVPSVPKAAVKPDSANDAPGVSHAKKASVVTASQQAPTEADHPSSPSQKTEDPTNGSYANAEKSPPASRPRTPLASAAPASSTATDVPPPPKSPNDSRPSFPSPIVDQVVDNMLEMIRQERQGLLKGPRITVYVGDVPVPGIAKRAAMAASPLFNKHFTGNPESLEYSFYKGQLNPGAIRLLLVGWLEEMCKDFEAYAVPPQQTFGEDVAILRAACLLGMERYCRHVLVEYVDYLKTQLPSYEEIVAVEKNATSEKDPLWTAMVNHLCHGRYKGLVPDTEDFETFLEKHPRLKKAMESADAFFTGYAKKQGDIREAERRQRWEDNQAVKRERIAREQRAAESLRSPRSWTFIAAALRCSSTSWLAIGYFMILFILIVKVHGETLKRKGRCRVHDEVLAPLHSLVFSRVGIQKSHSFSSIFMVSLVIQMCLRLDGNRLLWSW
jgi:hypothetical protein